jgi:cytochrome P450
MLEVFAASTFWITCLTAALIYLLLSYFNIAQRSSSSPTKRKIPRILYDPAIRAIFTGSLGNLPALHSRYGNLINVTFIGEPAILVGGLSNVRAVLNNDNFQADLPKPMVRLLGQGNLQTIHGKDHARDRKFLAPIFTPTNLKGYIPRVANLAQNTLRTWETACSSTTGNRTILAYAEIRKYVLRVGLELVLGFDGTKTDVSEYDRVSTLFTDLWAGFFTLPLDLPGSNYRKAVKARDELRKTILQNLKLMINEMPSPDFITTIKEEGEEEESGRTALELLLDAKNEDGTPVTQDHIMTLVTSLMLGALDTTATSLMLSVRRLALHSDVMTKARSEQAEIIAQHGSELTFESLRHMRYLDGVLKETIRLQTPVQMVFRRAVQDCEIGDGYLIPAGRKILVHVGEAIVNDTRWRTTNTADVFLPERWLSEDGKKTGGWLPFGGGPRLCPGQQLAWTEMKMMLATIVRGYAVELADPNEKWDIFPLMKPKSGMPIKVTAVSSK